MVCAGSSFVCVSIRKNESILFFAVTIILLFLLSGCNQLNRQEYAKEKSLIEVVDQTPSGTIKILPGFYVELLYEAPRKTQGTWVSLTMDDQGVMYASDEYQQGLYKIEVQKNDTGQTQVQVSKIVLPATGAQGLAWFRKSLYANVNGSGLFRMSSGNKDNFLDEMKFLGGPQSASDHGNHALVPVPDGSGLYVVNGNHTPLPEKYSSRVLNWKEDILLTRQWDANGHAMGILAPGGYVAQIDPDARRWDILSVGYRNTYDIAIQPDGEIFTFDSDMEWDMGLPDRKSVV